VAFQLVEFFDVHVRRRRPLLVDDALILTLVMQELGRHHLTTAASRTSLTACTHSTSDCHMVQEYPPLTHSTSDCMVQEYPPLTHSSSYITHPTSDCHMVQEYQLHDSLQQLHDSLHLRLPHGPGADVCDLCSRFYVPLPNQRHCNTNGKWKYQEIPCDV